MDHLATPFSHKADLDLIEEEEELANFLKPSPVLSNTSAGIPVPSSNSSELDHASGTSDDISGDRDAKLFTAFDKYNNAHFETRSISSLATLRSLFSQITSATRESCASI